MALKVLKMALKVLKSVLKISNFQNFRLRRSVYLAIFLVFSQIHITDNFSSLVHSSDTQLNYRFILWYKIWRLTNLRRRPLFLIHTQKSPPQPSKISSPFAIFLNVAFLCNIWSLFVPKNWSLFNFKSYGSSGPVLCWIESFLSNRSQSVRVRDVLSDKCNVLSGVPQGSVLGPILFLIFINDLPSGITSSIKLFADDSKLYRGVNNICDADNLQNDLDHLHNWTKEWKMQFNVDKCHVLHHRKSNDQHLYHLGGRLLNVSNCQKDLGIMISNDLSPRQHIIKCTKKANKILAMIKHTFTYKNKDTILPAYKSLIRPILEYCQEAWQPYLVKDIDLIESVQRRATKLIYELRDLTYEERLQKLDLFKLSDRRQRGDMISVFKIMKGLTNINSKNMFTLRSSRQPVRGSHYPSRTHDMALVTNRSNCDIRRNTFSQRCITPWNNLPKHIVESDTVDKFKWSYDNHMKLKN